MSSGRNFSSGAYRDTDTGKLDFEGFISPAVMIAFAEYMNQNRVQSDGNVRASDNWQKGIPQDVYMKSMFRHFMDVWCNHRGVKSRDDMVTALCGLMFNVQGMMFEVLRDSEEF